MSTFPNGRLPDFLIIGAAKAGTTTLHYYLEQHPRIFMSRIKEPCFFDADVSWDRGVDWYRSLFAHAQPDQLCGEASTNYTRYPQVPGVPERIAALIPGVKLIYLMRHPVERAYSHYVHRFQKELRPNEPMTETFEQFVKHDPMCLDGSDYRLQVSRYLPHFDRSSILFLSTRELRDPPAVLKKTLGFLGLDPLPADELDSASKNRSQDFQELVIRDRVTRPLRNNRALRSLGKVLPQPWKDSAYELLRKSPYGREVSVAYSPVPMLGQTRQHLLERYAASNEYVRDDLGVDTEGWND